MSADMLLVCEPPTLMSGRTISISGKMIASLRQRKVFSQEEFAPMVGVSIATLRRIEQTGITSVYLSTARKLADKLDVTPETIIVAEEAHPASKPLSATEPPAKIAVRPATERPARSAADERTKPRR